MQLNHAALESRITLPPIATIWCWIWEFTSHWVLEFWHLSMCCLHSILREGGTPVTWLFTTWQIGNHLSIWYPRLSFGILFWVVGYLTQLLTWFTFALVIFPFLPFPCSPLSNLKPTPSFHNLFNNHSVRWKDYTWGYGWELWLSSVSEIHI